MMIKDFDGFFASSLSDEEFAEFTAMTKCELAVLYVSAQVAAGVIGEPADRADQEAYVARGMRKMELIDGIVMLRNMAEMGEEDDAEIEDATDDEMDVTKDIADVRLWPASSVHVAMTIDESDEMRMGDDDDPITESRSFAAEWCRGECPEGDLPASDDMSAGIEELYASLCDEYDEMRLDFGTMWTPEEVAEYLYEEVEKASDIWTDEDEQALREMGSLWAYEMDDDDDDDIVDEWTEWLVLAGELERIDTSDDAAMAIWAWCPDHRAELPGADDPMDSLDEARQVFDAYDPLGMWFARRHAEAADGHDPQIWRRYEVDLVCQTCTRSSDGLIAVRDDAVRLSKAFDIDGDVAAQSLIRSVLSHI